MRGRGVLGTRSLTVGGLLLLLALLAPAGSPPPAPEAAQAATSLPTGFTETTVISGLSNPTVVRFASDGRVFVAEKSGVIKEYDSLADTSATIVADLNTNVYNFWDRGLLGMALDPSFPTNPYLYVLYTYDHVLGAGASPPRWGTPGVYSDPCPSPPGATTDGCQVSARLSRIQVSAASTQVGPEQLLVEDWCQQFPSHSIGTVEFGPDGALYAGAGDGASFNYVDYGQTGNPCADPANEGGALRSQDLRTSGDPVGLDGSIIRVDPATGAALPTNPNAGSSDPNARRIIAYGMRNPFRFTFRPGTSEIWIGDVGWADWEEIDRILSPTDSTVENFGWPCYEGTSAQAGYQAANLPICQALYANPNADTKPYFKYQHGVAVAPGDTCQTQNGSSVSGLSFEFAPAGSPFPAEYQGALFFADYSRNCIWAMEKNGNPIPSPGSIRPFAIDAASPVNLEFGPDKNLYYVDFNGGTIRRIAPQSGPPPTCTAGQYQADYFPNMTLSGSPTLSRCENAPLNQDWGAGSPGPGVPADGFSARWQGAFSFPAGDTTFTVTADDGIRLYVDGQLVIDKWIDQPPTTYSATRTLSAGSHDVKVEYYENAVGAVAQVSWTQASCAAGQYRADYFANMTLSGAAVLSRCESAPLNNDWGTGSPGPGVPADGFSTRWQGAFGFPAGDTTFTVTADDGIRLYLDGALVIDKWIDQSATTYTATRTLTAGSHDVKVEYYDNQVSAVAKVSWQAAAGQPPTVTNQTPAPGASGVAVSVSPSATFSEAMDPATLTSATFTLVKQGTTTPVAASVSYANLVATLDPTANLDPASSYTATVKGGPGGAKDAGGTPLAADVGWTFTTAAGTNAPPTPVIDTPLSTLTWKVGDTISFSGHASDPEQGALPASALSWTLVIQHCPAGGCHTHTVQTWPGVASGSFVAPDHEYPSYLTLRLTATDSGGAATTTSVDLQPQTAVLSFASSPSGLQLAVNSTSSATPFTRTVIVGSANSISATSPQTLSGTTYEYASWSDGGAQSHNVTAPAAGATYTATYSAGGPPPTCTAGQYQADYFANMTLSGAAVLSRCENAPLNNDWGTGSPGPGVPADGFSTRWQGAFSFPAGDTTFTVTADDGIRLYVDGVLVIDKWIDQAPTTYTATRTLTAGTHQVKVEYYENGGGAVAKVSWTQSSGSCSAGQYQADYFANMTLSGAAVLSRCENAPLNNDWGTGSPGPGVPADGFSTRWQGTFSFPAGSTTFTVTADDGIRLYLDGALVIDKWIDQAPTTYTATRTLTAGTHQVKVEYYENAGGAVAKVSWA
jgi:glucose/arabinose dehydrogenase